MRRREHLNDYQVNDDGVYEYAGSLWHLEHPRGLRVFLRVAVGCMIGAAVCLVAAGCIPAPGATNATYVLVPYAASVVAYALSAASLVRLAREGESIRDYVYLRNLPSLGAKLAVTAAGAILAAVAETAHLVTVRPTEGVAMGIAYVALCTGAGALMVAVRRHVGLLEVREARR